MVRALLTLPRPHKTGNVRLRALSLSRFSLTICSFKSLVIRFPPTKSVAHEAAALSLIIAEVFPRSNRTLQATMTGIPCCFPSFIGCKDK